MTKGLETELERLLDILFSVSMQEDAQATMDKVSAATLLVGQMRSRLRRTPACGGCGNAECWRCQREIDIAMGLPDRTLK